jgi:hypothetical protein
MEKLGHPGCPVVPPLTCTSNTTSKQEFNHEQKRLSDQDFTSQKLEPEASA